MPTPKVNDQCVGCGICANTASEVFEMSGGKSTVKKIDDYAPQKDQIDAAITGCPVKAISWE